MPGSVSAKDIRDGPCPSPRCLPAATRPGAGRCRLAVAAFHCRTNRLFITAPVERRELEQSVLADGTLQAQKLVSVGAQVSGQIKALHVALGIR